jgi:TPR repeat protein
MMIEQNTNYAYKLKYMDNPTFDKARNLSTIFYRELPQALQDELFEALNRGIDILDSEPQMTAYLFAYGKMHQAKLNYAFGKLPEEFLEQPEINIIDYGCGQALGTMCYADFLRNNGYTQKVKAITLIEPSEICLKRAALHTSVFFPDAEIKTVNKKFDDLTQGDIVCTEETPTLHILSNVLDILCFDLERFAEIMKSCLKGIYQLVCVGPYFKDTIKDKRMRSFAEHINSEAFYETLDKRELYPEKDWTCAVLLCSNNKRNVTEIDCDKVFEEAKSFCENNDKDLDSDYCKELFYKLLICARSGDAKCQNCLGIWYKDGIGTEQNYNAALEWYRKAAAQGFGAAYSNIAWMYKHGKGVDKNKKTAFENYLSGAICNHPHCQMQLGNCYFHGIGVEPDKAQAFFWYNKSAAQDYAPAFNSLAVCYYESYGIEKNLERTIHFLTKAAKAENITAITNLIKLFKKGEGIEYFGDEQYDVIVKAAQLSMKEALPVLLEGNYSTFSKWSINNWPYSCQQTYSSLLKTINDNNKHDDSRYDGLSETLDASFVFNVIKNIQLFPNKKLGFFRQMDWNHYTPSNSMFPYVYDSNVNVHELNIRKDYVAPSNGITAKPCNESFWEIFLLDNLKYFLPKFDHANYMTRHIVFSIDDKLLPEKITKHIKKNSIDLAPKVDCLFEKIIRIQCFYYNAWSGLNRWTDYYLFNETKDGNMNVTRLNGFSNQTDVLCEYDCGIKF